MKLNKYQQLVWNILVLISIIFITYTISLELNKFLTQFYLWFMVVSFIIPGRLKVIFEDFNNNK